MTRTAFIKSMIALFGAKVLPIGLLKRNHKIYLLQTFIRGFQFYKGGELLMNIKQGDELVLSREPENPHDSCAIAISFREEKLGYLPRESNEIISRLLDANVVPLLAEATFVNPNAATWENLHVGIFLLKESTDALPENAVYLSVVEKPDYRSLSRKKHVKNGDDFYGSLVENSEFDNIYSIIHSDIESGEEVDVAVRDNRFVVNTFRLPKDLLEDELIRPIESEIISLDDFFDEKGFVAVDAEDISLMAKRLKGFERVNDRNGRYFYEAVFECMK